MSLKFNNTTVENVVYDGTALCKLVYNGTLVWENHAYGSWTTTTAATCTITGRKRRDCSRCDAYETKVVDLTEHTYSDWIIDVEPTTATEGSQHRECTVCGQTLETATIPALNTFTFTLLSDGTYSVKATDTSVSGAIVIPSTYNDKAVTVIEDFSWCESLTSVVIGDGVTTISDGAFAVCSSLTSVTIPDSVTSIGYEAFMHCVGLTSVVLPYNVYTIGSYAFYGCANLESIVIPSGVASIGQSAFEDISPNVYYMGTESDWSNIKIYDGAFGAFGLSDARLYYYSESHPTKSGNYWRYVGGVPTAWCADFVVDEVVDSTCTAQGYAQYTCSDCGYSYKSYIPPLGHSYSTTKVGATCTEQGYDLHTCIRCDDSYKDNYTAVSGHTWNTATYSWGSDNSTCTATRTCKNDSSHTQTARGNVSSSVTTAATCTTDGTRTYYASFEETWPASQSKAVAIPKTGHTEVIDPAVAATCTTSGKTAGSHCSVCHTILTPQQNIPATGHSWNTPTYAWNGYTSCTATRTCKYNSSGHIETATGTISSEITTAATCTGTGVRTYTSTFDKSWASTQTTTESIAATGHSWDDWVTSTSASCTEDGLQYRGCKNCSAKETKAIPATGHTSSDWIVDTAATTASTGSKHKECTVCGATLETETIPKLNALTYTLLSDDTYSVKATDRYVSGAITIPSTYNGKAVTTIADKAFMSCDEITAITIPEGITYIGQYAFSGMSIITVTIPKSVTTIGVRAFSSTSLTRAIFAHQYWQIGSDYIELDIPATNATYLKSTYVGSTWTKFYAPAFTVGIDEDGYATAVNITNANAVALTASISGTFDSQTDSSSITVPANGIGTRTLIPSEETPYDSATITVYFDVFPTASTTLTFDGLGSDYEPPKVLAAPVISDAILSSGAPRMDLWVQNNNSVSVTCYACIIDDSGSQLGDVSFTIEANTYGYTSIDLASSAALPIEVYVSFSADGYEDSEEAIAIIG